MADQSNQPPKKLLLKIGGMHCPNCEVLIERKFKKIASVRKVKARHASGKVEVVHSGELDIGALRNAIADDGYSVEQWQGQKTGPATERKNTERDYVEIGAAFLLLVGLYLFLRPFDILPDRLAIPNTISYGLAFAIGVVASISTCIAVTGGLLVAVAAKYNAASGNLTSVQRFKPHIYFNVGRIVSYTLLGGAVGALGSTLNLSPEANGILVIAASAIMILLGLQMLKLLPSLGALQPRMPKFLAHKIHALTEREAKGGAFVLGASTFFLPCGFTQALQLYVLAKGSFETGALVMLAFALGTLPALLSLSAISSFARGAFQRYFLRFAGAAVVLLGLFNIQSGFTLNALSSGASTPTSAQPTQASQTGVNPIPIVDGKQVVNMKLIGYTYEPHQFTVVAGVPVEWRIDARQAAGCGRFLIAPRAGLRKLLSSSDITVISFTPQEAGDIGFNCGMGMMTRGSKFIVRANATAAAPAPVQAQATAPAGASFSVDQRAEVGRITKDYLIQHPEVIQEAIAELERRQQAAETEQHQSAVKENAAAIFSSPRQVVLGNPQGDVSLVEFFDYNCGYCKRALSDTLDLLKADPKLRIVLKEFPVLGDASVEAARVAVAVRMQDEGGTKYLEFHQKLLGGRGQADRARALAVAKEIGLDMARLERDMASPEAKATIDENLKLAESLGVNGTPSYVIGTDVVLGAIGLDALKEKVNAARTTPAKL
jgi:protein-disulfide isomerase/sulfite exporter TauE/SafE/copper chaperone CopZ